MRKRALPTALAVLLFTSAGTAQQAGKSVAPPGTPPATAGPPRLWIASWGSSDVVSCDLATKQCVDVVPTGRGNLAQAHHFSFGPDGLLYVASWNNSTVKRYDADTGAFVNNFVKSGSGGLRNTHTATWGLDGNLYCAGEFTDGVNRYDGTTGDFLDAFIPARSGNLNGPEFVDFGPDGLLYICDNVNNSVRRYDPETGAFVDVFVRGNAQGINRPHFFTWGPDGEFYITSSNTDQVMRFDGETGQFLDVFIPAGSGGLDFPAGLAFTPDGRELLVASFNTNRILRYDAVTGAYINVAIFGGANGFSGPLFLSFVPEPRMTLYTERGLRAGGANRLKLLRGTPDDFALFFVSRELGSTRLPILGGLLTGLGPPVWTAAFARIEEDGTARTPRFGIPAALTGELLFLEAHGLKGGLRSNVLRATIGPLAP